MIISRSCAPIAVVVADVKKKNGIVLLNTEHGIGVYTYIQICVRAPLTDVHHWRNCQQNGRTAESNFRERACARRKRAPEKYCRVSRDAESA